MVQRWFSPPPRTNCPVVSQQEVRNLMPDPTSTAGSVQDKTQNLANLPSGAAFVMTGNDGVDAAWDETLFWSTGSVTAGN